VLFVDECRITFLFYSVVIVVYLVCVLCGYGRICSAGLMYVIESNFSLKPLTHGEKTCTRKLHEFLSSNFDAGS